VDAALGVARDAGWIGDPTFARLWIEDRLAHHPLSRRAVENELRDRKVPHEVIAQAMEENYPSELEGEVAVSLAKARWVRLAGLDETVRRRRATDFLLRRGFSGSVAADSVRRVLREGIND
jgi:SOS response regulatory protein OraA/RecX